ncbi:MAG: MFS transporter [bacterium]
MTLPLDPAEPRYRWVVVFISALMCGIGFGLLVSVSVFMEPLESEFGWVRSDTSFAYSSGAFMTGLFGILMGRLVDRISVRPIVFFGALMIGASQLLLSRVESQWQLYLLYGLLLGAFGNGAFLVPLMTNAGSWFTRNRGLALGVVMAGQSLGGAVIPVVVRSLMSGMGWRETYLVLGVAASLILIPVSLLIRTSPGLATARAQSPAGKVDAGGLSPGALTAILSVAIVFCCICMSIAIIHVFPLALEAGIAPEQAALVLGSLMAVSMVGRVGIARLADTIGGVRTLLLASGIQTVTIYWFSQMSGMEGLVTVAVMFAIGYGGVIPSYAIIIREKIPLSHVGRVTGTVFFFGNLGMALGGYLGGVIYVASGGYPAAYAVGALAGVVNLIIIGSLFLRLRPAVLQPA